MSRHIIIDGHNFLLSGGEPFSLPKKDAFVERLRAYCSGKDLRVTVVFDSRSPANAAFSEQLSSRLEVIYAPYPEEADDVILRLVRGLGEGRELWVVSNDRRVSTGARKEGIKTIPCAEFWEFFERRFEPRGKKTAAPEGPEKTPRGFTAQDQERYLKIFEDKNRG